VKILEENYRLILQTEFQTIKICGGNMLKGLKKVVYQRELSVRVHEEKGRMEDEDKDGMTE
jgi:hypothetical protein